MGTYSVTTADGRHYEMSEQVALNGKQIADSIEVEMKRMVEEWESLASELENIRQEFESRGWSRREALSEIASVLRGEGPQVNNIATLIGDGARRVRAAYQANQDVGNKDSLFGEGASN